MNNPLISIIIPTFNRAHLIGETLDSVLAQTYSNWECIIVDDGSVDNTIEILKDYVNRDKRFQFHQRPLDRLAGGNAARNYGFELSKGDYINWFDSDDIMLDNFLTNAITLFQENEIDFVLFDYKIFKESIHNIVYVQNNATQNLIEDYITLKVNFGTWAFVWKRDLVSKLSFDESLVKAQDLDFNFRVLITQKYKYKIANQYGLLLRLHADSIVQDYKKNNFKSAKSELYVRKQVFEYMLQNDKIKSIQARCFELYVEPFMKVLRAGKTFYLFREVYSLLKNNKSISFSNCIWAIEMVFYLLLYYVCKKGEYKLKHVLLSFQYY
ncbi:glycosyltransferase family 2 protein [Flavobacterium chuncheonense]|uniref:Glycosyltransferase family 2 protein n=1 Tax=Flavobacterium chuncheonense TaxID=2026653 RepID=A0ABW5YKG8_9FLAO